MIKPNGTPMGILQCSGVLAALAGAPAALAEAPAANLDIVYGGLVETRLKSDQTLNRANGVGSFNNTFGEIEADWYANIGQHFSLNGKFILEQVREISDNSLFDGEGAYADQLYATVTFDPARLYGGKIHPHFGRGWDIAPGLYGTDFAEDYELAEKIGLGVGLDIRAFGLHTISAESFFADTTFLSNSIIARPGISDPDVARPGRARRSDGGVSNTGGLDNFALSLEGGHMPGLAGLGYTLGYAIQQGSDIGGEDDERSLVAGAWWELPVSDRLTLTPLVEYVHQKHHQGTDQDADYLTAGAELTLPLGWAVTAFGTLRDLHGSQTLPNGTDHLLGASVVYDLSATVLRDMARRNPLFRGIALEVGYKHELVQSEALNTVGFELSWEKAF